MAWIRAEKRSAVHEKCDRAYRYLMPVFPNPGGDEYSMSLKDTLEAVREYYVSRFEKALAEYMADPNDKVYSEAAILDSNGEPALAEGTLPTPSRADFFIFKSEGDPVRVTIDTAKQLRFKRIQTLWRSSAVRITLRSFQWNGAMLKVTFGDRKIDNWDPLRKWFLRWFKEDDPDLGKLLGGVHFISDPEYIDDYCEIMVDFGTAPVKAFSELFDTLVSLGADTIEVD